MTNVDVTLTLTDRLVFSMDLKDIPFGMRKRLFAALWRELEKADGRMSASTRDEVCHAYSRWKEADR